jgi:negative regulator of replication initiation
LRTPSADSANAAAQQIIRNYQNRPTYRIEIRALAQLLKGENAVTTAKQIAASDIPKADKVRQIRKLLESNEY